MVRASQCSPCTARRPGYSAGKDATDSAPIIEEVDLLHSGNVATSFVVSSDNDLPLVGSTGAVAPAVQT
jgi:hypothetical protein